MIILMEYNPLITTQMLNHLKTSTAKCYELLRKHNDGYFLSKTLMIFPLPTIKYLLVSM